MAKRKELTIGDKVSQIVNGIAFGEDFEDEITSEVSTEYLKSTYSLTSAEIREIIELVYHIKRIIDK